MRKEYENASCVVLNGVDKIGEGFCVSRLEVYINIPLRGKVRKKLSPKNLFTFPNLRREFSNEEEAIEFGNKKIVELLDKKIQIVEESLNDLKEMRDTIIMDKENE